MSDLITIEIDLSREPDGRWKAVARDFPSAVCLGSTGDDAVLKTQARVHREIAERLERGEHGYLASGLSFVVNVPGELEDRIDLDGARAAEAEPGPNTPYEQIRKEAGLE